VFQNLRGYDSHLSLKQAFGICGTDKHIGEIPNALEKCMTCNIGEVKVIDSFQGLALS
jgi:hypothetical protein